MSRRAVRAVRLALLGTLAVAMLAGCGGSSDSDGSTGSTGSTRTASGSASASAPVTRATGSPFTGSLSGPSSAKAGQTIQVTMTNTGRLPNVFQLEIDPASAATVETTVSSPLEPGASITVPVQVHTSPFDINLESASGGLGDYLDTLEVASVG